MALQTDLAALKEGLTAINEQLRSFTALQRLAKRLEEMENTDAQTDLFRRVFTTAPLQEYVPFEESTVEKSIQVAESEAPTKSLEMSDCRIGERAGSLTSFPVNGKISQTVNPNTKSKREEGKKTEDQLVSPTQILYEECRNKSAKWRFEVLFSVNDHCVIGKLSEVQKIEALLMSFDEEKWSRWERDRNHVLKMDGMKICILDNISSLKQKGEKWRRREESKQRKIWDRGKMPCTQGESKAGQRVIVSCSQLQQNHEILVPLQQKRKELQPLIALSFSYGYEDFFPTRISSLTPPFNKQFKEWIAELHNLSGIILGYMLQIEQESDGEWMKLTGYACTTTYFRLPTLRTRLFSKRAVVIGMVQRRREETWHEKWINVKKKHSAHQVFDIMHLQQQRLHQRRKMSLALKTWKFKYKQRVKPPMGHNLDMIKRHATNFEWEAALEEGKWAVKVKRRLLKLWMMQASFQHINRDLSLGSSSQMEKGKGLLQYKASKVVNHLVLKERDNVWITPQEKLVRIHQLLLLRAKTWGHWFDLWISSFSIWHRWKNKIGCDYVVFGGSHNIATLGGFFLPNKSLHFITLRTRLISRAEY